MTLLICLIVYIAVWIAMFVYLCYNDKGMMPVNYLLSFLWPLTIILMTVAYIGSKLQK